MRSNDKIRELVDGFVNNLDRLIRETVWETAKESLGMGGLAPAAKAAPIANATAAKAAPVASAAPAAKAAKAAPAAKAGKGSGKKRNPADIDRLTNALLAAITAKPGLRMEQLRQVIGASKPEVLVPVARLLDAKKIRRTGEKRATQYYPAK